MEAIAVLQKMRQQGLVVKAQGTQISLSPKHLINDKMISFVRKHKEALLTALYKEQDEQRTLHLERKRGLRDGRLQILRETLCRYIKPGCPGDLSPTKREVEEYLDSVLKQHDYDVEDAITTYRNISAPVVLKRTVICNHCKNFTPDEGSNGIGYCALGINWTQERDGRVPLYPYAERHCDKFINIK